MKPIGCLILLTLTIVACNSSSMQTNTVFDKLVGTWKGEDGKSFERWSKQQNGTFQTVAFTVHGSDSTWIIQGSDTSWNETARIYPENGKWIFQNTVKGQNEDKAVKFTSSILTDSSVQFSNPAHDFPTDVNYTVINANSVRAFIVGPNSKGGKDTIPFHYSRVK